MTILPVSWFGWKAFPRPGLTIRTASRSVFDGREHGATVDQAGHYRFRLTANTGDPRPSPRVTLGEGQVLEEGLLPTTHVFCPRHQRKSWVPGLRRG
jgi:hypothetical protein